MTLKIAVIGGGSSMFVPGLVRRLLEVPCFEGAELRLMDIDENRLSVMEKLARELAEAEHRKLFVSATRDRQGRSPRRRLRHRRHFCRGDAGVGDRHRSAGEARSVYAHRGFHRPRGYFPLPAQHTGRGPSGARAGGALAPGHRLQLHQPSKRQCHCHGQIVVRALTFALLVLSLPVHGQLVGRHGRRPGARNRAPAAGGGHQPLHRYFLPGTAGRARRHPLVREHSQDAIVRWAIDTFGVVPYCANHWIEFFPQLQRLEEPYQGRAQGLAMRYGRYIYDMDAQEDRMRGWERVAAQWSADAGPHRLADLPHGPEDHGIVVVEVMESIIDDKGERFIVNVMNDGLIPNLPPSVAVEVPSVVTAEGVHPIGIGRSPQGPGRRAQRACVGRGNHRRGRPEWRPFPAPSGHDR